MKNKYGKYFDPDMPIDFETNNPFRHMQDEDDEVSYQRLKPH